ncbi:MAG: 2-hydroxyglutaryl-CoA dehydratase, partial [Ruminococcaceae bacterium]|nr:2-hydroxyglutaryl-CoA dehydratase [Oscillospiraceae bacterium]
MSMKLGIDIGSTTLKAVVLDAQNRIVYQSYERHLSNIRQVLNDKIRELGGLLRGESIKVAVTGSAALGISNQSGIPFFQEVFATAEGVRRFYPRTEVVIELGGEDA